jgi:hypothetical protein
MERGLSLPASGATGHPTAWSTSTVADIDNRAGRRRLSSFRVYLRRLAAGRGFLVNLKSEKSLLPSQGDDMKIRPGVKPAVWGAVAGAVVLTVVGDARRRKAALTVH